MGTITEERKRERFSKIALLFSLFSLIPFLGSIFLVPSLMLISLFYLLSKRAPEKYGGLLRLKIAFGISLVAIFLQYSIFFTFFKYKIEQAEEVRYEITQMRLYSAAEALENYEKEMGVYPVGENAEEIEKQLNMNGILHTTLKDGWERDLIIKCRMWDYRVTAMSPPKNKDRSFPVLRGQKPKPVFPYIGSQEDYNKLVLE